jgi:adenosine deaminase
MPKGGKGTGISKPRTSREAKKKEAGEIAGYREFLKAIPKTEIHVHLEGLASVKTIWSLIEKHRITIAGVNSPEDIRRRFQVKSLPEFIDLFLNVIQNSFREESDVRLLIDDARAYLKRNNIVYAEIHFAPSAFLRSGHRFDRLISVLDEGSAALEKDGLRVRYLVDVSRTFGVENAMRNLELTLDHRIPAIIGIGLGGQEAGGPARDFVTVFERARAAGLRVVAHAGEAVGPESVRDAVEILGAERIGHGVSAILDPSVVDLLDRRRIPLEMCPSSNLFTGHFAKTLREHPIGPFFMRGLRVTVNSDDPTIFGVDLVDEYVRLVSEGVFDEAQTLQLLKNGIYATFLPPDAQDRMWAAARRAIEHQGRRAPE